MVSRQKGLGRIDPVCLLFPVLFAAKLSDLILSPFFENDFVKTRSLFEVRKEGMRKILIYKDVSVIHRSRDGIHFTRMKFF